MRRLEAARYRKPVLGTILAMVLSLPGSAVVAINNDHGWTHLANDGYPQFDADPECQPWAAPGCIGWDDDGSRKTVGYRVYIDDPFYWPELRLRDLENR